MKQRGFAPILIVIILALIGIISAYYFSTQRGNVLPVINQPPTSVDTNIPTQIIPTTKPTSDPITNWKTLSNQYGFRIKYPSSLKIEIGPNEGNEDETNSNDLMIYSDQGDLRNFSPAVHINVYPKSMTVIKSMTLAQISEMNYEANLANKNTIKQLVIPLKSTILDNKPAYTYTMIANGYSGKWEGWTANSTTNYEEKLTVVESENKENYFIIVYSANDSTMPLVFSTFQFTQ